MVSTDHTGANKINAIEIDCMLFMSVCKMFDFVMLFTPHKHFSPVSSRGINLYPLRKPFFVLESPSRPSQYDARSEAALKMHKPANFKRSMLLLCTIICIV